jgi:hypothetical protein
MSAISASVSGARLRVFLQQSANQALHRKLAQMKQWAVG